MKKSRLPGEKSNWWRFLVAIPILVVFLAPFYILLSVAFRSPQDLSSYWAFPTQLNLENFRNAIEEGKILLSIFNSLVVTVGAVLLVTVVGALAAYPLARRKTRLNMGIKGFVLGIMMVPPCPFWFLCTPCWSKSTVSMSIGALFWSWSPLSCR